MSESNIGVIGVIGGTGLGQALLGQVRGERIILDTPFGRPSAPIIRSRWEDVDLAFLPRHGETHTYPPSAVPFRANIYALKALGVTHIIASGATGSLREEIRPRDLVIVDQVIDRTVHRPSTFFDQPGVAVHVEFAQPFCPPLRRVLLSAAEGLDVTAHDGGTYVCVEGPAFSTVAESRMHRAWGADLVGMTCMPEAKLAREAEICYALVGLPTDYDCWRPHDPSASRQALLAEIIGNIEAATANCVLLIKEALRLLGRGTKGGAKEAKCSCRTSLDLAVWTKRECISPAARRRYGVLLSRCLGDAQAQGA